MQQARRRLSESILPSDVDRYCGIHLSGPLCELCDEKAYHYVSGSATAAAYCAPCGASTIGTTFGVGVAFVVAVAILTITLRRAWAERFPEARKARLRWIYDTFKPQNKLKIVLGFYMLAAPIPAVYNVGFPDDVRQLLRSMEIVVSLGIDLGMDITPLACLGLDGHLPLLLFWTIGPLVLIAILFIVAAISVMRDAARDDKLTQWQT